MRRLGLGSLVLDFGFDDDVDGLSDSEEAAVWYDSADELPRCKYPGLLLVKLCPVELVEPGLPFPASRREARLRGTFRSRIPRRDFA